MLELLAQADEVSLALSLNPGLLLGKKASVMTPNGVDLSFLCLPPSLEVCGVIFSLGQAVAILRYDWR